MSWRRLIPRRLQHGEEATLTEHLGELRHRMLIGLLAVVPVFAIAFGFHSRLIDLMMRPLPDDKDQLLTLSVTEPFTNAVKVSLFAALAVALPVLLWQIWGFLAPAMNSSVQRAMSVFVAVATVLFATGVAFAYLIILPAALDFLTNFDDELYADNIRANYYFSFVTLVMFATGIAFEMPIFILALVRIGALSSEKLRKNRRIGVLIMVVFAILLPTVDPVSLALETIPLLLLFEASIWLSAFMEKRWERSWAESWDAT
ncbi:MAG: twin-arginine translocase subunit TatC [Gaiella sp.]